MSEHVIQYLEGQLLVAMPSMPDQRFERTVIFMCAHSAQGAMGIVVNKLAERVSFPDLIRQLGIAVPELKNQVRVHAGGPVETGRGFVLHSADFRQESTLMVGDSFGLTATVDILRLIAEGGGPKQGLLALGYAGWAAGQLDSEIQQNGWLHAPADPEIVFDASIDTKWQRAVRKVGIDPSFLSSSAGHA